MKIKHIRHGIACRIGDTIYIHKDIPKSSNLYFSLLAHEMAHSSGFSIEDVIHDLHHENFPKKEYWTFVLKHPSSWTEFLPINVYEGKITFNISLIVLYSLTLIGLISICMLKG